MKEAFAKALVPVTIITVLSNTAECLPVVTDFQENPGDWKSLTSTKLDDLAYQP